MESRPAATDGRQQGSSPFVAVVRRVETASVLDPIGARLAPIVDSLTSSPSVRNLLRGTWLGHAVHPLLTDFPLGAWMCSSLVDLVGGRRSRPVAEGLLAFGIAAAVPTAMSGAAEWAATEGGDRRVGVLHAGLNVVAVGCYGTSLFARRRDRHAVGVALGLAGGLAAIASGYLGGHLSIGRKIGTRDAAFQTTT